MISDFFGEEAMFVPSKRGNANLMDTQGYIYMSNRYQSSTQKTYWVCCIRLRHKCHARAVTSGNTVLQWSGVHTHPPTTMNFEI